MNKKDVILCRCEDVSLYDLHEALDQGYTTFEELKRILRVGMGACQANTCGLLIQREIAKYLKLPLKDIKVQKVRPLFAGVPLKSIAEQAKDES